MGVSPPPQATVLSGCTLYLLGRTPPQEDAATIPYASIETPKHKLQHIINTYNLETDRDLSLRESENYLIV